MIWHLNGFGWLRAFESGVTMHAEATRVMKSTHEMVPEVTSTSGVIWTPSTTSFEILSTARDMATEMKRDASAR